jgi:hypothetical protein
VKLCDVSEQSLKIFDKSGTVLIFRFAVTVICHLHTFTQQASAHTEEATVLRSNLQQARTDLDTAKQQAQQHEAAQQELQVTLQR